MRKAALALGVVALGLFLWFALRRSEERGQGSAATTTSEQAAAPAAKAELVEGAAIEEEARAPVAAEEHSSDAATQVKRAHRRASATSPVGDESIQLSGTIVVVDENGAEHPSEDGTFSLMGMSGIGGRGSRVEVRAGAWTASVPAQMEAGPVRELQATAFLLGGRSAIVDREPTVTLPLPADGFLALRVRWPARSILHVRDRASERELAPVLALDLGQWAGHTNTGSATNPGAAAEHALDLGPSPVVVEPSLPGFLRNERMLRVCSPGYGWAQIALDETSGGERFLFLDPASELEVRVSGALPVAPAQLWIYDEQSTLAYENTLVAGATAIDALAPGSYRVEAAIGERWNHPLVLAEQTVEVVAGRRASVELVLAELAQVETVTVAGTLLVSPGWDARRFQLELELLGAHGAGPSAKRSLGNGKMEALGPGSYRWKLDGLQPGRYDAAILAFGFHQVLEVPPAGIQNARIEVPAPCQVEVRCVDDESGDEVLVENVFWSGEIPHGVSTFRMQDANWNETTRRWELRAPEGRIWVNASSDDAEGNTMFEVHGGASQVELRMIKESGVRLVLRDGAATIPWDDSWEVTIHALEGQDEEAGSCWNGFVRNFAPGRYRLELSEIPGYEPVPDPVVVVEKGVVKEHVIELVRRP